MVRKRSRHTRRVVALALALLGPVTCDSAGDSEPAAGRLARDVPEDQPVAFVAITDGAVTVARDGEGDASAATPGQPLRRADRIDVPEGASVVVMLVNNHLVHLDSSVVVRDIVLLQQPVKRESVGAQLSQLLSPKERQRMGSDDAAADRIAGWQSRLASGETLAAESQELRAQKAPPPPPPPVTKAEAQTGDESAEVADDGDPKEKTDDGIEAEAPETEEVEDPDMPEDVRDETSKRANDKVADNSDYGGGGSGKSKARDKTKSTPEKKSSSTQGAVPSPTKPKPSTGETLDEGVTVQRITWSIRQDGKTTSKGAALPAPFSRSANRKRLSASARALARQHEQLAALVEFEFKVEGGVIKEVRVKGGHGAPSSIRQFQGATVTGVSGPAWIVIKVELR